jgi:AcrR family transcriptional regulator
MASVTPNEPAVVRRRVPTQLRSRERVERILDASSRIVVERGVDALTTRAVSELAEVPVASIYQYFADKDAILLALVERDTEEMDEQVRADLGRLELLSLDTIVATTMRAYVTVYHRRPSFVEIWLRGRTNAAVRDYGRRHNERTAAEVLEFAIAAGLTRADTPMAAAVLAVEIGDRVFQLAFEKDIRGDEFLIAEGIALVTAYLRTYATQAGVDGVRA